MLIDGTTQTNPDLNRRLQGERFFREGVELWRRKQELARLKKLKEQQEIREMLENYYPFGHAAEMKPRGLRNLRLEGLFPNRDFLNAKRFVGGGGGAPLISDTGRKVVRTREDPLLRFQFGTSNDLKRCVDNTLRYKTDKKAQQDYKKELGKDITPTQDKLVEERKRNEERDRIENIEFHQRQFLKTPPWGKQGPGGFAWRKPSMIGFNFLKSLGWSTEKTLKKLDSERTSSNETGKSTKKPPGKKLNPIFYPCKNTYLGPKNRKLSPLPEGKENGIELVPLLAKQRRFPLKIHLDTTDVTNQKKINYSSLWNRQGSSYLRELTQQMALKQQRLKEMKAEDGEIVRNHFSTWDGFWGRPGHGAPKSAVKKQRLDRLLYPQMVPISVH